jgi:hypothetical protein
MRTRHLNGLLIVASLLISTAPLFAQAKPDPAKLKDDAQKVVSIRWRHNVTHRSVRKNHRQQNPSRKKHRQQGMSLQSLLLPKRKLKK